MKAIYKILICSVAAVFLASMIGCCSVLGISCSTSPTTTLETEYGSGTSGRGLGMVDKGVGLIVSDLGNSCAQYPQFITSGSSDSTSGLFTYTPACNQMQTQIYRQPSSNCPPYNQSGLSYFSGNAWVYNAFQDYAGSATTSKPYILPCANSATAAVSYPPQIDFVAAAQSTVQMIATGGSFNNTYGMPQVSFYDPAGNVIGSSISSDIATDGSSITFSPQPIYDANVYGLVSYEYAEASFNANADSSLDTGPIALIGEYTPPGGCDNPCYCH